MLINRLFKCLFFCNLTIWGVPHLFKLQLGAMSSLIVHQATKLVITVLKDQVDSWLCEKDLLVLSHRLQVYGRCIVHNSNESTNKLGNDGYFRAANENCTHRQAGTVANMKYISNFFAVIHFGIVSLSLMSRDTHASGFRKLYQDKYIFLCKVVQWHGGVVVQQQSEM